MLCEGHLPFSSWYATASWNLSSHETHDSFVEPTIHGKPTDSKVSTRSAVRVRRVSLSPWKGGTSNSNPFLRRRAFFSRRPFTHLASSLSPLYLIETMQSPFSSLYLSSLRTISSQFSASSSFIDSFADSFVSFAWSILGCLGGLPLGLPDPTHCRFFFRPRRFGFPEDSLNATILARALLSSSSINGTPFCCFISPTAFNVFGCGGGRTSTFSCRNLFSASCSSPSFSVSIELTIFLSSSTEADSATSNLAFGITENAYSNLSKTPCSSDKSMPRSPFRRPTFFAEPSCLFFSFLLFSFFPSISSLVPLPVNDSASASAA
mmetsp:Transcript_21716/g.46493  ORF Transcript_21716/g.46493 Transcript_21716/m.46493 type:complete len:321 (-) Transcript_21716:103-1065(-)